MRKLGLLASVLLLSGSAYAAEVQTSGNCVLIRPDGGQAKVIRLEVMNDNIIRVRATSKEALPEKPASLMIVPQTAPAKGFAISEEGETVVVKTKNVIAEIANLYCEQLGTLFPYVTNEPLVLYNRNNVPIFHFVCASFNKTAVKIAQEIIDKK